MSSPQESALSPRRRRSLRAQELLFFALQGSLAGKVRAAVFAGDTVPAAEPILAGELHKPLALELARYDFSGTIRPCRSRVVPSKIQSTKLNSETGAF